MVITLALVVVVVVVVVMAVVLVVMVVMIIVVIFVVENSPTLLRLEQLGVLNYLVPLRTQAKLL